MKYFKKIEGERLYLSPMSTEDLEAYLKWVNDYTVSLNTGFHTKVYDANTEGRILKELSESNSNFGIIRKEDNQLIGQCGLGEIDHIHRRAVCGLFIGDEENRGKGYGVEILDLLLQFGFEYLNLNNIMLRVFGFNKAAVRCYEKAGFQKIGERRNALLHKGAYHNIIYMDILADEYWAGKK